MYHLQKLLLNCLMFTIVQSNVAVGVCKTPKNEPGECVLLKSCPTLLEMLKNKTSSSMEFVRNSICGFDGADSKVCCLKNNRQLLASRMRCGYQHSDDYEHNSNGATINEFPWLARIFYKEREDNPYPHKKQYRCIGSLLSTRYVLTAAHCITTPHFIPVKVQLGEYHSVNDTDCVTATNIKECSDPTIWYGIEKVIAHREYNMTTVANDIALIRLNDSVTYSDYIRPICLPYPGTTFADIGNTLITSGWGVINLEGKETTIKKKVLNTLISNDNCSEAYTNFSYKITLTEKHICTVAFENSTEFSCRGDSGGPVIFQNKLQWHQEGIISFGRGCGAENPGIHTRVEKYLDWIEENIEP